MTDQVAIALLTEGRRRYEAGDYADAEPLARRALELLPPGSDALDRAVAVQLAGECAFSLGRYREALELADEAAALRARAPDVDVAETRNLQGVVAVALGEHQAGHERLVSALQLREAALGPGADDTLESLNNVGVALGRLGRMGEAIAAHEEALRRCEAADAGPSRQLAVTCNALAAKLDRGEATRPRARELYRRALWAAEAALGPEHPMVATLTANLATERLNEGDADGARPLVERALDLHERRHGAAHPSTATTLLTAAELARLDGRLDDARSHAARATEIRLGAFGFQDPRTRQAFNALLKVVAAQVAIDLSHQADAAALMEVYRSLSPDQPVRGDTVRFRPDPVRGEWTLRAFLAREAERRVPPDPLVTSAMDRARAAWLAADTALMRGDGDVAVLAARDAVERIADVRGPEHLDLLAPLVRLAGMQRATGALAAAMETDRRIIGVSTAAYGDRHPHTLGARGRLAIDAATLGEQAVMDEQLTALRTIVADADPQGDAARLVRILERVLLLARATGSKHARAGEGSDAT